MSAFNNRTATTAGLQQVIVTHIFGFILFDLRDANATYLLYEYHRTFGFRDALDHPLLAAVCHILSLASAEIICSPALFCKGTSSDWIARDRVGPSLLFMFQLITSRERTSRIFAEVIPYLCRSP